MPHHDDVHSLQIALATALRERDTEREFRGAAEAAFGEQLARTEAAESERDALRVEVKRMRETGKALLGIIDRAESKDPHSPWCNGVHEGGRCEGDSLTSSMIEEARAALASGGDRG